ncbi:MAG: SDR family NAD(P)-dependent oxidoreductase [Thermoflexales bacterium]
MDLPDIDLEGRVVIMTGADRGLGRAMSLGLAEKGARLVLASPVMDGLNAVAEEIAAIAGPGARSRDRHHRFGVLRKLSEGRRRRLRSAPCAGQ